MEGAVQEGPGASATPLKMCQSTMAASSTDVSEVSAAERAIKRKPTKEIGDERKKQRKEMVESDKKKRAGDLRRAVALKERYLKVVALQSGIERNIKHDDAYEWARNPNQLERFRVAKDKLDAARELYDFNGYFLLNDMGFVKAKYPDADLGGHYAKFMDMQASVEDMEREQSRFNRMHNAQSG